MQACVEDLIIGCSEKKDLIIGKTLTKTLQRSILYITYTTKCMQVMS